MVDQENWWYGRKFALASIALSIIEASCFVFADPPARFSLFNSGPSVNHGIGGAFTYHFLAGVWIFLTPLTLFSGALALSLDVHRGFTVVAQIVSVVVIVVCSLQMLN